MGRLITLKPPYHLFLGDALDGLDAKTAFGLAQWHPELCVGWSGLAGCKAELPSVPRMELAESYAHGARSLVIGVAPVGGRLPGPFIDVITEAIDLGFDIVAGLHDRLNARPDLVARAERNGCRLVDLRDPPKDLVLGDGQRRVGKRILTIGTDLCVGKKYTALAITHEMVGRGLSARFRATGQTGILIAGEGIAVDAVPGDFISGAIASLSPDLPYGEWDVIEGQGCVLSPITSTSLGVINGAQADALVLCHDPSRASMRGLGPVPVPVPSPREVLDVAMIFASRVNPSVRLAGISLNTSDVSAAEANALRHTLSAQFGVPVCDPIKEGVSAIVDDILSGSELSKAAENVVPFKKMP